jgi:hypothetical protein
MRFASQSLLRQLLQQGALSEQSAAKIYAFGPLPLRHAGASHTMYINAHFYVYVHAHIDMPWRRSLVAVSA